MGSYRWHTPKTSTQQHAIRVSCLSSPPVAVDTIDKCRICSHRKRANARSVASTFRPQHAQDPPFDAQSKSRTHYPRFSCRPLPSYFYQRPVHQAHGRPQPREPMHLAPVCRHCPDTCSDRSLETLDVEASFNVNKSVTGTQIHTNKTFLYILSVSHVTHVTHVTLYCSCHGNTHGG